jgi:hypothetical protein
VTLKGGNKVEFESKRGKEIIAERPDNGTGVVVQMTYGAIIFEIEPMPGMDRRQSKRTIVRWPEQKVDEQSTHDDGQERAAKIWQPR